MVRPPYWQPAPPPRYNLRGALTTADDIFELGGVFAACVDEEHVVLVRRRAVLDGEATGLLLERDGVAMSAIAMLFRWSSMRGVLVTHLYPRSALTWVGSFICSISLIVVPQLVRCDWGDQGSIGCVHQVVAGLVCWGFCEVQTC